MMLPTNRDVACRSIGTIDRTVDRAVPGDPSHRQLVVPVPIRHSSMISRMNKAIIIALACVLGACGSSNKVSVSSWAALGALLDSYVSSEDPPPSGSVSGYSFILYDKSGVLYSRAGGNQTIGSVLK